MSSAGGMMTHRCQLERDAGAGYSDTFDFKANGSPVICKLWATAGQEPVSEEKVFAVEDLRAIVPVDTDVHERDAVHGVTDRRGTVIDARQLLIQTVLRRRDHLELVLQVITT